MGTPRGKTGGDGRPVCAGPELTACHLEFPPRARAASGVPRGPALCPSRGVLQPRGQRESEPFKRLSSLVSRTPSGSWRLPRLPPASLHPVPGTAPLLPGWPSPRLSPEEGLLRAAPRGDRRGAESLCAAEVWGSSPGATRQWLPRPAWKSQRPSRWLVTHPRPCPWRFLAHSLTTKHLFSQVPKLLAAASLSEAIKCIRIHPMALPTGTGVHLSESCAPRGAALALALWL